MTTKVMGTPPDLLTRKAAASALGVTQRTLSKYVSEGLLEPVVRRRKVFFQRIDILALRELFQEGRDLTSVTSMALRALVRAQVCEKKLNDLLGLLGFGTIPLSTTPKGILELYKRAKGMTERIEPILNAGELFYFAKELLAINEDYLRLVTRETGDNEPWRVFLDACEKICRSTPSERLLHDHELATAYSYVVTARRHARSTAYFYVRSEHGREVADRSFIGDNAFDPVITILFPN